MMRKGRQLSLITSGGEGGRERYNIQQAFKETNEINAFVCGCNAYGQHLLWSVENYVVAVCIKWHHALDEAVSSTTNCLFCVNVKFTDCRL